MKIKGCAFEIISSKKSRYFTCDSIESLPDFMAALNRSPEALRGSSASALPIRDAKEVDVALWHHIADHPAEAEYPLLVIMDFDDDALLVNEDTGDGMGLYYFPLGVAMQVSESGTVDLWHTLLTLFPKARKY